MINKDINNTIKNIYRDTYLLYTKYHGKLVSSSDWEKAAEESRQLYKTYPVPMGSDMILAVINQLEREWREHNESN